MRDVKVGLIYKANDPIIWETVELDDDCRDDEVLVKVYASSICHSDEFVRHDGVCYDPPVILGHEGAGIVEKVGAKVTSVKPGDHVVMTVPHCGHCDMCKQGYYNACENSFAMHFGRFDGTPRFRNKKGESLKQMMGQGSFSEYTMVFESSCIKIDDDIPFDIAAPVGCGFTTGSGTIINYLKPDKDDSVVVYGVGATGIASIMGAKLMGVKKIIAVSRSDEKLALAKELGATELINRTKVEAEAGGHVIKCEGPEAFITPFIYPVNEAVKKSTDGKGADYAIVTAPVEEVAIPAMQAVAKFGECCITASIAGGEIPIPIQQMQSFNTKMSSCGMGAANPLKFTPYLLGEWKKGNYPIDRVLKHYKFADVNQAFHDMEEGIAIKPVMEW